MSHKPQHPLQVYLDENEINYSEAGELFACADTTIARIIKGNRPPNKQLMQRMIDVTAGALLPNDFYRLPSDDTDE